MNHYDDLDSEIRCQFCGKESWQSEWKKDKCPHCKREYDAMLAQESDD